MKNNKGFMLAEAVITSTVVLTTLIGLYTTFTRLYNLYNIRATYFDIDGVYAIKGMVDHLIDTGNINVQLGKLENNDTSNYASIVSAGKCIDSNDDYCSSLKNFYNIENMFIVKYDKNKVDLVGKGVTNQTFKDYIDYISNYYAFNDEDGYVYLFIVEYKNGDDLYYSSLGLG